MRKNDSLSQTWERVGVRASLLPFSQTWERVGVRASALTIGEGGQQDQWTTSRTARVESPQNKGVLPDAAAHIAIVSIWMVAWEIV